ncbi:signal peptidase complex subunit 1 [Marchantia polymorpha subsp. ruderalis]|nr:hypothetical protein Mapa_002036 [Marchantia paleacea]PTQ40217.1 hypothetical protein MARPO_0041s0086 [Marchantia polymorpha]BBN09229.1 hypothetical protein Mp_4g18050 [Marchantia polymorpha subsp. ruderalis]|eukprot:PTQ40217.1 hypothetical protein MARPO_0041s0086 [Marchantia polymorpha]
MDWQGQKLSEQLMQYLLLGSALIAFLTGYIMSSYRMMLTIYLIGVVITFLFTVPDWSFFNRHPLEWSELKNPDMPSSRQLKLRQQQAAKKAAKPQPKR